MTGPIGDWRRRFLWPINGGTIATACVVGSHSESPGQSTLPSSLTRQVRFVSDDEEVPRCDICGELKHRGTFTRARFVRTIWMCGSLQHIHDEILAHDRAAPSESDDDIDWDDEDEMRWDDV